jgi:Flp pilus assembly protein TadD
VAKALLDSNRVLEATRLLRAIVALHPVHAEAYYLLGFALTVLNDNADEAEQAYGRAMELGFNEFWIRYNRGSLYLNMSQHQAALADLELASQLDPSHSGVLELLTAARERLVPAAPRSSSASTSCT